jgi:hypothetical protein
VGQRFEKNRYIKSKENQLGPIYIYEGYKIKKIKSLREVFQNIKGHYLINESKLTH